MGKFASITSLQLNEDFCDGPFLSEQIKATIKEGHRYSIIFSP